MNVQTKAAKRAEAEREQAEGNDRATRIEAEMQKLQQKLQGRIARQ